MTRLKMPIRQVVNGVAMDGQKDQMALYPTQKKTYNKLQTIKGHEHDCGRPGINGGYIANPKCEIWSKLLWT